jgi:ABC-2 type transport system permease protein
MKHYLKIYALLFKLNYNKALAYRSDTISGFFGSFAWAIFSIIALFILTARSSSVFGWTRDELFILIGVFNIIVGGIFRMLFSRNFENLSRLMRYGNLDGYLLKPMDTQFLISTQEIRLHGVIRTAMAILYTYIVLMRADIQISLLNIFIFIFLSLFSLMILYAMWFLIMTIIIWLPDLYNLHEVLYSTDSLTRYPPQILPAMQMIVFYIFFPFTLVVSIPTKALLNKLEAFDVLILCGFALGLLYISRLFWKFALRYYTSASG